MARTVRACFNIGTTERIAARNAADDALGSAAVAEMATFRWTRRNELKFEKDSDHDLGIRIPTQTEHAESRSGEH